MVKDTVRWKVWNTFARNTHATVVDGPVWKEKSRKRKMNFKNYFLTEAEGFLCRHGEQREVTVCFRVVGRTGDERNKRLPSRIETIHTLLDVMFRSQNIHRGAVWGVGNAQTVEASKEAQGDHSEGERRPHGRNSVNFSAIEVQEESKLRDASS